MAVPERFKAPSLPSGSQHKEPSGFSKTGNIFQRKVIGSFQKPNFSEKHIGSVGNIIGSRAAAKEPLLGGKTEASRAEIRKALKINENIKSAQKSVGLDLSKAERAGLEKEVFSQSYGRSISKKELKQAVHHLETERVKAEDAREKNKLKKEIKFFKKIGGI